MQPQAAQVPRGHGHGSGDPSAWVARFAPLAPAGEILDVACGSGRHALLFAALGHPVLAIDRDANALARLDATGTAGLKTLEIDLETGDGQSGGAYRWPFQAERFAAIVVTNYLHRPLLPHIVASLAPGGMLIYETFARGNERFGKPSNPAFLLTPGELLRLALSDAQPLRVVAFEDGAIVTPAPGVVQRLCALRPGGAASDDPPRI